MSVETLVDNMSVSDAVNAVRETHPEEIDRSGMQKFSEGASIEDNVRQGDVYITYLGDKVPDNLSVISEPNAKLVEGNTEGSQHILSTLEGVVMYEPADPTALTGSIIHIQYGNPIVTHPRHGDWMLYPGVWAITYQRAFADDLRAVRD